MNQTKKRLQIINIAISITDIETIQLQILKLANHRSDARLQEIIAGLQAQNYAQTQALITQYIETPTEEILQRTPQDDQEVIEQFDLFVTTPEEPKEEETELFDFDVLTKKDAMQEERGEETEQTTETQNDNLDNLLNLTAEDVMPDNIQIDIHHSPHDDFFDTPPEDSHTTRESHIDTDLIPKDDFFNIKEKNESVKDDGLFEDLQQEETKVEDTVQEIFTEESIDEEKTSDEMTEAEKHAALQEQLRREMEERRHTEPAKEEKEVSPLKPEEPKPAGYKPIPYIDQKLKNMLIQYPPLHESSESYDSVNNWLLKISRNGYNEEEVEEVLVHIRKLKEKNDIAEAAQLLLISAATESKFAQFMLARELFRGELLQKNLPESFTLINRLAMDDDYPEAICDLAQFYENGVGIDKDRKKAEALYHEAMELGVKRAAVHYERLHNTNKGLFGKFFGK
jgi:hypothetical protein